MILHKYTNGTRHKKTNLWLYIQHRNLALLMDLLNGLNFGTKHTSLETAILQEFIPRDALGHGFIGDEIVLLSIFLVLAFGSCCVCTESKIKTQWALSRNM